MKKARKLVIFGSGRFAEVAAYYFAKDSAFQPVAFTVNDAFVGKAPSLPLPVVPFESLTRTHPPSEFALFVAVGYTRMNRVRAEKCAEAKALAYTLASYVSSRLSRLEPLAVGENCFILEDNTLQPFVSIGDDVVLWSGNHIGHHSRIDDHCFITSHACIGGGTSIGKYSFVGMNATIKENTRVGESSLIGAGALILSDTPANSVYALKGTPLRRAASADIFG